MDPKTTTGIEVRRGSVSKPHVGTYISSLQHFDASSDLEIGGLMGLGGFSDVYKARLHFRATRYRFLRLHDCVKSGCKTVAVKRFRVFVESVKDITVTIDREVQIWSKLKHRNILPLLGYVVVDGLPALVSEWMENGPLSLYWKQHPEAEILPMALGIMKGLMYLHETGVIHSDLKCDNILISNDGCPLLSDFGISRLHIGNMTITGTTTLKGNTRWMAIELIHTEANRDTVHKLHTKESDVWAFGMVLYVLLSNKDPYHHLPNDASIIRKMENEQEWYPLKPSEEEWRDKTLSWLWDICIRCWVKEPMERPTMHYLLTLRLQPFDLFTV